MTVGWTELAVAVPLEWHEFVAEALALTPFSSVAFGGEVAGAPQPRPGSDWVRAYVIESDDTPELRRAVGDSLATLADATGAEELRGLTLHFRTLPPEDYANAWRKSWRPMRVANFAIVPRDWNGTLKPTDRRMVLEPGGAFGTGRHPTTRACLRAIERLARPGQRVLDAGCGNGVLAVACALRGVEHALGFDIDPTAVPYANELAEWNGVTSRCEFRAGAFECLRAGERNFDGVLANIYADLIQAFSPELSARLRPGGWFVFSGCHRSHRTPTVAAITAAGLEIELLDARGQWDTFVGTKR